MFGSHSPGPFWFVVKELNMDLCMCALQNALLIIRIALFCKVISLDKVGWQAAIKHYYSMTNKNK